MDILQSRLEHIEAFYKKNLEKLLALEKIEKDKVNRIIEGIKTVQVQVGVVSVISQGKKPAVMIEGLDKSIVYEGEKVNGIKVIKIYPERVKFRKGLKSWEQKVGQAAHTAWKSS